MDNPTKIYCGICDAQHITKTADFWCPECDEGLCTECKNHHSFSKASRHHGVILIEDYRKLSTDISNIMHHCTEHEKNLQMYCPHHNQLCCLLCISTSHKDCTGMLSIEEIAKTSQSGGLLESLQKSLEDLKYNIDKIVKDRQINLTKIKEQRKKFDDSLKILRKRINIQFDKLEKETVNELNSAECDVKTKIEDLLKELQEKSERIAVLQKNISDLHNHASDLQTFIGSKTLEEKIEFEETYIQSLTEDERLRQFSLNYNYNKTIESLFKGVTSFGFASTESSLPTVEIKLHKDKQAQIMSASVIPKGVDDFDGTFSGKLHVSKKQFRKKRAKDHGASWAAYYAKFYSQTPNAEYGGQTQQTVQQSQQPASQQPAATINPQTGQPDYSQAWAEYYRQQGMFTQAQVVLQRAAALQAGAGSPRPIQPPY
ncbi:protein wech-like [Mytilus californianus]|uniref:protein wech-like n=1 Tax=Mytilus californianus TaxID=6549 RepID=UPI002246D695|nr:protein wech-like [Mytilus californianus]XP_052100902.1 protein wech-like [Mytilus californianus]